MEARLPTQKTACVVIHFENYKARLPTQKTACVVIHFENYKF